MARQTIPPCEMILAVSTLPAILSLLAMRTLADAAIGIGQASEEIFRGDRLPVLNIHSNNQSQDNSNLSDSDH